MKERRNFLADCELAFNTAIVSYDEGLIGSDRELAASLWRTFFQYGFDDFQKLEVLVEYVRAQVKKLHTIK